MLPYMLVLWFVSLLGLAQAGLAPLNTTNPGNITNPGNEFNICDGTGGYSPILYHNYTTADCVPKFNLGSDGNCSWIQPLTCGSFCQQYTYFEWGQESPFTQSDCNYPLECSLTESSSTSWNWGVSFTPKIGKALKVGVSGSYGQSYGQTTGRSWSFQPEPYQCGYFTFVPVRKVTCGIYSEAALGYVPGFYYCDNPVRSSLICAPEVWNVPQANGKSGPDGTVIFINTDCNTRMPLPANKQHPVYGHPGVALDRGLTVAMQKDWVNVTCSLRNTTLSTESNNTYVAEIYAKSLQYGSVGTYGATLAAMIGDQCNGSLATQQAFTWYSSNGTYVNTLNATQLDGSMLPNKATQPDATFGTIMSLELGNLTYKDAASCVETAIIMAGALEVDCADDGNGTTAASLGLK